MRMLAWWDSSIHCMDGCIPMRTPIWWEHLHPHEDTRSAGMVTSPDLGSGETWRSTHRGLVRQQLLDHFNELVLLVRVKAVREEQGRCGQTRLPPIPASPCLCQAAETPALAPYWYPQNLAADPPLPVQLGDGMGGCLAHVRGHV